MGLSSLRIDQFSTVVFAGGGNRCWWQAGLISRLIEQGIVLPTHLIGTSAGAAIAAAYLVNSMSEAINSSIKFYQQNKTLFQWEKLLRLQVEFAHREIYPLWIKSFMTLPAFEVAKVSKHRLTVAVTHPNRVIGTPISIVLATAAYLIDKKVLHSIHPKIPKYIGLSQGFYSLNECTSVEDAQLLLCAAAAVPPVMPPSKIEGLCAFDGGYTDNAPIVTQSESEKVKTLVLLTRHYPKYPTIFQHARRTYLQPSRPVPVSTWDCTAKATISDAFSLGYEDAQRLLKVQ